MTGICFYYQKGSCWKGSACTYLHEKTENPPSWESSNRQSPARPGLNKRCIPAKSNSSPALIAEFMLFKGKPGNSPQKGNKINAMTLMMNASKAEKKEKSSRFPSILEDALKRKKNVNLYIKDGEVVWQFAFNVIVKDAIKEHIKGRRWDPNVGVKGSWVCPLESLSVCIALYEHMGRTADSDLKKRAEQIQNSYGGNSAADAIKLTIQFSFSVKDTSFGNVNVSFLFDADIVDAIKMLPPPARNYDHETKSWNVELQALPDLLEYLESLQYVPSSELREVCDCITGIETFLHEKELTPASTSPTTTTTIDLDQKENGVIKNELSKNLSLTCKEMSYIDDASSKLFFEDDDILVPAMKQEMSKNRKSPTKSNEINSPNTEKNSLILKEKFEKLIHKLKTAKKKSPSKNIDRSNCGKAKVRRITYAQMEYSSRMREDYDDDYGFNHYDNDYDSVDSQDFFSSSMDRFFGTPQCLEVPSDCDCGKPHLKIGGKHTCKYFGTFECYCGNTWTSAHCWKGEKQACRSCNRESLPVRTDKLDGRRSDNSNGAHDSLRCAMCRRLGYDCSGGY